MPEGRGRGPVGPRRGSRGLRELEGSRPRGDRRHLPARHQGAHGGQAVRRGRSDDRADRSRGARGGRRHDRARRPSGRSWSRAPTRPGRCEIDDPDNLSYLTQTTLSVDETNEILDILRERFPAIEGPPREDICYATQNRQDAVKALAPRVDVVLVIGSEELVELEPLGGGQSRELGTPAYLVDDETEVDPAWLAGAETVGLTSGASAPEWLVDRMLAWLASNGFDDVEVVTLAEESVRFSLPPACAISRSTDWPARSRRRTGPGPLRAPRTRIDTSVLVDAHAGQLVDLSMTTPLATSHGCATQTIRSHSPAKDRHARARPASPRSARRGPRPHPARP